MKISQEFSDVLVAMMMLCIVVIMGLLIAFASVKLSKHIDSLTNKNNNCVNQNYHKPNGLNQN